MGSGTIRPGTAADQSTGSPYASALASERRKRSAPPSSRVSDSSSTTGAASSSARSAIPDSSTGCGLTSMNVR